MLLFIVLVGIFITVTVTVYNSADLIQQIKTMQTMHIPINIKRIRGIYESPVSRGSDGKQSGRKLVL